LEAGLELKTWKKSKRKKSRPEKTHEAKEDKPDKFREHVLQNAFFPSFIDKNKVEISERKDE
jgi:hypothetical protein